MKKILDWQSNEIVNVFDEVTLWSAPFGRLLLENIPMLPGATIVDIGFGTGFPLIELSQRFGNASKIYGIDIWKEGIACAREKIKIFELENVQIIEESAAKIRLDDDIADLVTSNLGINNFDEKEQVYREVCRLLRRGGRLAITTNPTGTFQELFDLFNEVFEELNLEDEAKKLIDYVAHRSTKDDIVSEICDAGFILGKSVSDTTNIRFVDAEAMLDHALIRIGFRQSWDNLVGEESRAKFYEVLVLKINDQIKSKGEFVMTIPMLYLEFEKN